MSEHSNQGSSPVKHVFDGIEEHDNRLPNWWLGILWVSIVFAFGYWFYYQPSKLGPDQKAAYDAEVAENARRQSESSPLDDNALLALAKNPTVVSQGRQTFEQNCVACHGAQAQGVIGPNLTDKFWLHGGKPMEIHKTISDGVLAKGMPSWRPTLGPDRVKQLAVYVLSLRNTNVPGKEPQGEPVE
jgi:cytochrome c oxidase cbb3-type subunit 3